MPHAEISQQSSEVAPSQLGTPAGSSPTHASQPRPGSASVWPGQEHVPAQPRPSTAGSRPLPSVLQPPLQASQPVHAAHHAAQPQPGARIGTSAPVQNQPQPGIPAVAGPMHATAAPAGAAGAPQQQNGSGDARPEGSMSPAAGLSQGLQSHPSEAERAARLATAIEKAAAEGADKDALLHGVSSFRKGTVKAIVNEVCVTRMSSCAGTLLGLGTFKSLSLSSAVE